MGAAVHAVSQDLQLLLFYFVVLEYPVEIVILKMSK